MFKFGTIGAFKQVRNNPRCKVTKDSFPGEVVLPNDATGKAPAPASADQAKGEVYVLGNIIDKPEILNKKDFKVLEGEFGLAFNLADLKDLPVEIDASVVKDYAGIAKGNKLVSAADGSGKWIKADGTSVVAADYKVHLEVLEKSTFGGQGLYCSVRVK